MSKSTIKLSMILLQGMIDNLNHHYYVLDNPLVPDAEYDKLFQQLLQYETDYPELKSMDSPTMRVGGLH